MTNNYTEQEAPKERRFAGQGAIFLCAVLWSTSGLFIKLIDWHPMVIAGTRSLVSALFMLGVRTVIPAIRGKPKEQKPKNSMVPLWIGAAAYALTMITFVIANKLTAPANAIVLQYSAPIWAAILGWLLIKEKPHWESWVALVFIFGGFSLFFRDGLETGALLGDIVAILSGFLFGAHSVLMRMQKNGNPSDSMLMAHVITFAASIPFIIMYPPVFTSSSVMAVLFMGIIQIGCASLLYSYGIKFVSAAQAMLTATVEPLLNPVWVLVITGEMPSMAAITGGGIILAAVLFSTIFRTRPNTRTPASINKGDTNDAVNTKNN